MTSVKASYEKTTSELSPFLHNGGQRTLSRSPHPYHRRSSSLQKPQQALKQSPVEYSESSDSTESEERGTEADDEKGSILKGLPAPPLRGRKGLRGSKTPVDATPSISPFPTPPAVNDRRLSYFSGGTARKSSKINVSVKEQDVEEYKKYVRRRHAEVARRFTETALLLLISGFACQKALANGQLAELSNTLWASSVAVLGIYLLYPLRITIRRLQNGCGILTAIKTGFHIPSRFDPGPLLYPIVLPFLISVSCTSTDKLLVVGNIVLGIASLPPALIPHLASIPNEDLHWALSLVPFSKTALSRSSDDSSNFQSPLNPEELILLFPLHQSVLTTLKYLTSTSLDPAEIQLLATGLINLALFAASPQAEILKALLWVGALCIFVVCQKPLSWEVRLARIPSWKFARNKAPKSGLSHLSENILGFILPAHRYNRLPGWDSDDEDYEHLKLARKMAKNHLRLRRTKTSGPQSDLEPMLKREEKEAAQANMNGLQRSLTTTANGMTIGPSLHRRKKSLPQTGLLSFTYNQAQACKWLISGYVFSAVLGIILIVVRYYVSTRALSSYEPFGWAIGYLFGDISSIRLWVVSNNLDTWIRLPGHTIHNVVADSCGWVEQLRQTQIGPANLRLLMVAYCIGILTSGIGAVLILGSVVEVDTRRKVFHGMMVAILAPTIFIDPCFIALALSLILAIFLLLDLFRASQLPPISKPLTTFLAPYVDGRDYRGPVIVSPMFLLIGCAIPLWLSLAGAPRAGKNPWIGWDTDVRELSMISGVICVGMGDAAASLIGRRYGKTKWFWGGGKSLEGSLAFAVAVTIGLAACYMWLRAGGWVRWDGQSFPLALVKMAMAGSGASILESVLTAGNDNVIVPVGLWLLTRGLDI